MPGSESLSMEFYLCFWEDLGESLLVIFNESFHAGSLPKSQYEGLLRLIHKKDDQRLLKNWRPISLLNTDYKSASNVITEHLKKVMSSIVHQDKTCGVVGCTIFSNLLQILLTRLMNRLSFLPQIKRTNLIELIMNFCCAFCVNLVLAHPFVTGCKSFVSMRFHRSLLMGLCPALSTFVEGFGRAELYLHYFIVLVSEVLSTQIHYVS